MSIKIQIDTRELRKTAGLTTRKSLVLPMNWWASKLRTRIGRGFDEEKDPEGNAWADLKPATWARKNSPKILYETGKLRKSVRVTASRGGLEIDATAPYAVYLQRGTSKMPARPFIGMPEKWLEEGTQTIREYIRYLAKKEGK